MAALAAYFDDSKNASEGIFAVAGYLSFANRWDQSFTPEWARIVKSGKRHGAMYFGRSELTVIADDIRNKRKPKRGTYMLPKVFDSTLSEKIRALLQP